jgi:glycerophosphoryl diester phosphodiesterase
LESRNGSNVKRWYVYNFTLAEIKRLDAGVWFNTKFQGARVPTFKEAIDEIRGKAGLYPELKDPEVYTGLGVDVDRLLMTALDDAGLWRPGADKSTPIIIQLFSATSLKRLFRELNCKLPLVLLVDQGQGAIWLGPVGMLEAKEFAWGLGPAKNIVDAQVVQRAHAAGLVVTPYTFRSSDTGRFSNVKEEMDFYLYHLGVDGVFTDNPDQFPRGKK